MGFVPFLVNVRNSQGVAAKAVVMMLVMLMIVVVLEFRGRDKSQGHPSRSLPVVQSSSAHDLCYLCGTGGGVIHGGFPTHAWRLSCAEPIGNNTFGLLWYFSPGHAVSLSQFN